MAGRKITLFEIHPHGNVQLGRGNGGDGGGMLGLGSEEMEEETEEMGAEEESGGGLGRVLLPLIALVVIAAAVKYLGGEEMEEETEEADEAEGRLNRYTTTTE